MKDSWQTKADLNQNLGNIPQKILGLPPATFVSNNVLSNSMPIAEITPCKPSFKAGLTLFRLKNAADEYRQIINRLGFNFRENKIRVAFLADNFPTDSFTNEYGASFLEKITGVAERGIGDLVQMSGGESITGMATELSKALTSAGQSMEGIMGDILTGTGKIAGGAAAGTSDWIEKNKSEGGMLGRTASLLNQVMAGHRVDFPQVWKNSSFNPSYSMTIRLYNPKPGKLQSTRQYIVGPLALLLALGLPRTVDGHTYKWPFFHKVKVPGVWGLDPAVVTNISVIKGGDQQQIAMNQQLGIVDVRIDFISLFASLVVQEGDENIEGRPTLRNYLDAMLEEKQLERQYTIPVAAMENDKVVYSGRQESQDNWALGEVPGDRRPNIYEDNFAKLGKQHLSPQPQPTEFARIDSNKSETGTKLAKSNQDIGLAPT